MSEIPLEPVPESGDDHEVEKLHSKEDKAALNFSLEVFPVNDPKMPRDEIPIRTNHFVCPTRIRIPLFKVSDISQ